MSVTPTATPAVCGVSNQMTKLEFKITFKDIEEDNTLSIENQIRNSLKNTKEFPERVSAGQLPGLVIVYSGLRPGEANLKGIERAKRLENTLRLIPEFAKAAYHPEGLFNAGIGVDRIDMEIYFLVRC